MRKAGTAQERPLGMACARAILRACMGFCLWQLKHPAGVSQRLGVSEYFYSASHMSSRRFCRTRSASCSDLLGLKDTVKSCMVGLIGITVHVNHYAFKL